MNKTFLLLILISIFSCSERSPNKYQLANTIKNMECYEQLVLQLQNDSVLIAEIEKIKRSNVLSGFDPVTVNQEYKLVALKGFMPYLDKDWMTNCKTKVTKENDLRGVRLINSDLIVLEIDEFNRRTMTERTSSEKTWEFHRIIISEKEITRSNFYFGTEHEIWRDTLQKNWIYEVTQLKQTH